MKKYLALTIGPIFDTLAPMQKTASIFKASYLFSYLMREVFRKLYTDKSIKDKILFPYIDDEDLLTKPLKAGVFPDTLIIETETDGDFDKLISARNEAIKKLALLINIDEATLKKNLQLYCLEWETDKTDFLGEIRKYIAAVEKRKKGLDPSDFLSYLVSDNSKALIDDAFGHVVESFRSLIDISCHNLKNQNPDAEDYKYINANDFRLYHKHIAVIQADGDNLGEFLKIFNGDKTKLQEFSKKIMNFGVAARDTIANYGGLPVYIGGDDMLMFVPLVGKKKHTIFHLITSIDDKFELIFKEYEKEITKYNEDNTSEIKAPTMSYGIAVTYHKFPLNEAREMAYKYLEEAKSAGKNRIVLKSLDHRIDLNIHKELNIYTKIISPQEREGSLSNALMSEEAFLKSWVSFVQNKLPLFRDLIDQKLLSENMILTYFKNHFNEPIHQQYVKSSELISKFITSSNNSSDDKMVASILQLFHFLNRKDDHA